ncbi:MAG TPA: hypothetical protein VF009_05625 [Solirubrobacterales bacterium]
MTLSADLSRLAARVKETEERAASAKQKSKADLEAEVASARAAGEQQAAALREGAERGRGRISAWWEEVQKSWSDAIAAVRQNIEAKKGEADLHHAQRKAEHAERDAEFAIDFAYSAAVEAEYEVLDAALARMEADELAQKEGDPTSSAV